jgi:hypothetical protein
MPFYFQGEIELKGVWNGRGYPLFWLDTGNHHSARTILDQIAGLDPTPRDAIRELAGALRTAGDWPCRLYLPGSTHQEFILDHVELREASERLASVSDTSREVPDLPDET